MDTVKETLEMLAPYVIVLSAGATGLFALKTAKNKGRSDIEITYIGEMKVIIENYRTEKEALTKDKQELQQLVDKVKLINSDLERKVDKLERENDELKKEICKMKGGN
jgi:peptidoglycan hydrolase CwlO-like protein